MAAAKDKGFRPRAHTPEELADAERLLKEGKPLIDQMKAEKAAEMQRWENEITVLERRTRSEYVMVELGSGDEIALRSCISDAEMATIMELARKWQSPDPKTPADEREAIAYELVERVTANPIITKDWLMANRDKFATSDMVIIILTFLKSLTERAKRQVEIQSFRTQSGGPELR